MKKPIAVTISDIHFNINNLELASIALKMAIDTANDLKVPLIIAGDLHDTKAIIRAEVANRLLELIGDAKQQVYILVGNHDLINEKGKEHGLNYLAHYAEIIDKPTHSDDLDLWLIPYQTDLDYLSNLLTTIPYNSTIIMHQGFLGAQMGDYIQDKTSIDISLVKDFCVYSGHYHRHQTLGTVTYLGSPYTQSFGEAKDPEKGFLVIYDDGSFQRLFTNLRKHVILEITTEDKLGSTPYIWTDDLLWVKMRGKASELQKINKKEIGARLLGHSNFKLDLIPLEQEESEQKQQPVELTDKEMLNNLISCLNETEEQKKYLKELADEIIDS